MNKKYIIFPLGNSGQKYAETRHNAGRFVWQNLNNRGLLEDNLKNNQLKVFLPSCFMNESGIKLQAASFKLQEIQSHPQPTPMGGEKFNLIVIYDDKDLEIGDVKVNINRGDGGHNGLKNIIQELGSKNFYRIRIGIAPKGTGQNNLIPPHGEVVQKYVLAKMTDYEKEIFQDKKYLEKISEMIKKILNDDK